MKLVFNEMFPATQVGYSGVTWKKAGWGRRRIGRIGSDYGFCSVLNVIHCVQLNVINI